MKTRVKYLIDGIGIFKKNSDLDNSVISKNNIDIYNTALNGKTLTNIGGAPGKEPLFPFFPTRISHYLYHLSIVFVM
ncbi:hypothetical protein AX774_g6555 [Zancudomyces culisetae]|uniref:Uncharacterized protein n=1 Tax=Zancudomyces culisetae TaxID=1213189 RepID=A0A1R1PGA9_ZANCU|nr:hypothetical protein AX774_g6555 [Zancudomyces culisetae]|eukprot:OMH80014.1 hypothetical protein AX774_g6555 [Zancudomyces culisetae]